MKIIKNRRLTRLQMRQLQQEETASEEIALVGSNSINRKETAPVGRKSYRQRKQRQKKQRQKKLRQKKQRQMAESAPGGKKKQH